MLWTKVFSTLWLLCGLEKFCWVTNWGGDLWWIKGLKELPSLIITVWAGGLNPTDDVNRLSLLDVKVWLNLSPVCENLSPGGLNLGWTVETFYWWSKV